MAAGDLARIKERVSYDPATGDIRWRVSAGTAKCGSIASSVNAFGYGRVKIDRKHYAAHRIAWALVYGQFPESDLDHVNGVRTDNRIENLRLATRSENQCNRGVNKNNTSGQKGVNWNPGVSKWAARCAVNGKRRHLGYFNDLASATLAYKQAAAEMHGKFFKEA